MRIYIASSWANCHAVVLLTKELRRAGHEVLSFVEQASNIEAPLRGRDVSDWIASPDGVAKFAYDTAAATESALVVYIGPSGCDAWAEVGAAWASGVPVVGLWSKKEQVGLMRHMVGKWFHNVHDLLCELSPQEACVLRESAEAV